MEQGVRYHITHETVAELAVRKPLLVRPETPVRQVAAQMREAQLGCAIVVDATERPLGKFTQRQLLKLLVESGGKLDQPVSAVMYQNADTVSMDTPVADLVRMMGQRQIRYLTVVDQEGKVVGLTGQKGVMEYLADHFPRHVKVQRMKPLISMEEREGA